MPFGGAEALGDVVDRRAAVDQRRHGDEFVGRMHRGADRVFHQARFRRASSGSSIRHGTWMIGVDDAFGGELLQDLEAAAAGIDLVDAFAVDRRRMNDQVLQDAFGADAGFELGILGRRGRRLADIGRGQDELTKADVADIGERGRGLPLGLGVGGRETWRG